jgi:hypothetical protein
VNIYKEEALEMPKNRGGKTTKRKKTCGESGF